MARAQRHPVAQTQADLASFVGDLGARGLTSRHLPRYGEIAADLLDGVADLPRPSSDRLRDIVRQQVMNVSEGLLFILTDPDFDTVPINRR